MKFTLPLAVLLGTVWLTCSVSNLQGQTTAADKPATTSKPAATAPAATQPATQAVSLPGIHIDQTQKLIDLDATVVLREGQWLELLACSPKTREYESVLAVDAKPSHIHLALVMLGLEPGKPIGYRQEEDRFVPVAPHGPAVAISIRRLKDNQVIETPANEWIINQKTRQVMPDNRWLFAGSSFAKVAQQETYLADLSGTAVALVNFGDDVLTRPTTLTNDTDEQMWGPNTDVIPPLGTKVILRLKIVEAGPTSQSTTQKR